MGHTLLMLIKVIAYACAGFGVCVLATGHIATYAVPQYIAGYPIQILAYISLSLALVVTFIRA